MLNNDTLNTFVYTAISASETLLYFLKHEQQKHKQTKHWKIKRTVTH